MAGKNGKVIEINTGDSHLKIEHLRFIDYIFEGYDKFEAYQKAYPKPKKSRRSISQLVSLLLANVDVKNEIEARVEASKLTKPYLLQKLKNIIEERYPLLNKDGDICADVPNPMSIGAIREIAQLAGYYPEKAQVNLAQFNNIIVNMPLGYSEERKKELDSMAKKRLVE